MFNYPRGVIEANQVVEKETLRMLDFLEGAIPQKRFKVDLNTWPVSMLGVYNFSY